MNPAKQFRRCVPPAFSVDDSAMMIEPEAENVDNAEAPTTRLFARVKRTA
ncbi:MAG TPA: hypothetical protein VNQ79_16645 [Blastocatellia bacterium]|nr:hypothetical protein [Blastocatellia bacterium]